MSKLDALLGTAMPEQVSYLSSWAQWGKNFDRIAAVPLMPHIAHSDDNSSMEAEVRWSIGKDTGSKPATDQPAAEQRASYWQFSKNWQKSWFSSKPNIQCNY